MNHGKKIRTVISIALMIFILISLVTPSFAETLQSEVIPPFELTASQATKIARVTGATPEGETLPNPNQTHTNYELYGTDLGVIWDATTDPNEKKAMVVFGDSFGEGWIGSGGGGTDWRSNVLAITEDTDLSDGLTFSSMITEENNDSYAKEIIHSVHDTSGNGDFTTIPTAGVSVGSRHYIHYMQIKNWGPPGRWETNFSEIAYSDDDGENWTNSGVKWDGTSNFAMAAFVEDGGYVYMFGTKSGRFDSLHLARVAEDDMLIKENYEYWDGSGWAQDDEASAVKIVEGPISELSVMYNSYYDKWIMTYLNENRAAIVMRSSSSLTDSWSAETEIAKGSEFPAPYGAFIHPWTNDGKDLYFVMTQWFPYNVFLMHSILDVGEPVDNLIADPSFEQQTSGTISEPWVLESGNGGIDLNSSSTRSGDNNVWLRNSSGWNSITQSVSVEEYTEYRLVGFVKTSPSNNGGYFGVRGEAGNILKETKFERHDNYTKLAVQFNSGSNTSVTVFTGMWPNGDTWVQLDDYMLLPVDTTPPIITLNGDETIEVPLGGSFTDEGATAADNLDGDLSHKIEVSGTVDTNIIGIYTLTYNVTDADGNDATPVRRTIIVSGDEYTISNESFRDMEGNTLNNLTKKGFVLASADIRNNTSEPNPVTFVVVLYNKKGEIENLSGVTNEIISGATETFTGGFKLSGDNSGYYVEVFVADSLTGLQPLSNVEILEQQKP